MAACSSSGATFRTCEGYVSELGLLILGRLGQGGRAHLGRIGPVPRISTVN